MAAIWWCRSDPRPRRLERVLPGGSPQLIINLEEDETRTYAETVGGVRCIRSSGAILSGIATNAAIIDTDEQRHVVGVSFRPGGTVGFFGPPASQLCNVDVPLELVWGRVQVSLLRERLLAASDPSAALAILEEALLATRLGRPIHRAVAAALEAFQSPQAVERVGQVIDRIGLSAKGFVERFKAEVGIAPKVYCRILRFQRAVGRSHGVAPVDWSRVAADAGYFDQSHLIRDFQAFAGLTPGAYRDQQTIFPNHVAEPAR